MLRFFRKGQAHRVHNPRTSAPQVLWRPDPKKVARIPLLPPSKKHDVGPNVPPKIPSAALIAGTWYFFTYVAYAGFAALSIAASKYANSRPCLKDPGQTDQILEQPATPRPRFGACWPGFVVSGPAKLSLPISNSLGTKIYLYSLFVRYTLSRGEALRCFVCRSGRNASRSRGQRANYYKAAAARPPKRPRHLTNVRPQAAQNLSHRACRSG